MKKELNIHIHRLHDTDYEDGLPYIQIKPHDGIDWSNNTKGHQSSGTGVRKKDDSFEWDPDVSECTITFTLDERNDVSCFDAEVSVYFDNDGVVSRYDGVGKMNMLTGASGNDLICTLYDNGDEDLPSFGEVIYSYDVIDVNNTMGTAQDQSQKDSTANNNPENWTIEFDEQHQLPYYYNHITYESTWERPVCLNVIHSQTSHSSDTTLKSPQHRHEGTVSNPTDFSSSGLPLGTTVSDLSVTLKTGSKGYPHPQHAPTDTRDIVDNVSISGSKNSTSKQKKMRKKTPAWAKFPEYSDQINRLLKTSMADIKPESCNFGIRVHSMMCSNSHDSIDLEAANAVTSAQLKFSIQPFPGKGHVIKTKMCDVDSAGMLNFDFNLQSVSLSMGAADLKSKAFLNGVCPHVSIEFSCMGSVTKGCLFLPEVVHMEENRLIWVNMLPQEDKNSDGSSRVNMDTKLKSTLVLEIVKANDHASTTTTDESSPSSKKKLFVNTVGLTAASISVDIGGISSLSKLKLNYDKCFIEATLSCSGQHGCVPITSKCIFKEGAAINTNFTFVSEFPKLDILFLKIFEVDSAIRLLGSIEVPVTSFVSGPETPQCLQGPFKTFCVERPPSSKSGVVLNKLNLNDWAIVCTIHCAILEEDGGESPINKFLGHTALTTLNEDDEIVDAFEPPPKQSNNNLQKRQFETVNSVDGLLHVSVHGFVPREGCDELSLGKADALSIEFSLPNASQPIKEKTESAIVGTYANVLCSLWEKEFSFPLVWAVQQRFVGFLQGSVYISPRSGENAKGKKQRQLGYITLDFASMVNLRGEPIVCTLPVTTKVCGEENFSNCIGYVMLGLKFTDGCAVLNPEALPGPSDVKIKPLSRPPLQQTRSAWGDNNADHQRLNTPHSPLEGRGSINRQMSPLPLPTSAFSDIKKSCIELWSQFCKDQGSSTQDKDISGVSVSLSSIEVVAGPLRDIDDEEEIRIELSSNESVVSSSGSIDLDTGKICLEASDIVMPVDLTSRASILQMIRLIKAEDDEVLGEATLVLPRNMVVTGKPMNIAIPLRDSKGLKIAVVVCGLHFSSLAQTALEESDKPEMGCQLQVCVIEGNIVDSVWTSCLEPYFECSLNKSMKACLPPSSFNESVQTPSVDIHSAGYWNATCSVPLPAEAVADPSAKKQGSTPLWSLNISCRDAARRNCPVISKTQVNIPWSLLTSGKPMEQWVNLIPNANGVSLINEPDDIDDGEGNGNSRNDGDPPTTRLHLRIGKVDHVEKVKNTPFRGVGHIVMWFHSIREGEYQSEKVFPPIDILAAEASVQSIDNRNDYYEDDSNLESAFYNVHIETRQSIFVANNIADVLSGSVAVPGGHSINHLRITARHEKVELLASLPTLATLPKPTQDSSLSLDVPIHEAVLRPNINENFTTGKRRQRMSRLKMGAVYVPFVVGVLHIEHSNLQIFETAADKFQMSSVKTGALRYSLGGNGCFTSGFNMSVHEDGTSTVCSNVANQQGNGSVISQLSNFSKVPKVPKQHKKSTNYTRKNGSKASKKLRSVVAANKTEIRDPQFIYVDTYELLSHAVEGMSCCADIFDLTVSLLDLDSSGENYCMGYGQVKTSPIYFQALRMLLSAPQNVNQSDSGCVPSTMPTEVKLFDKTKRKVIGSVHITLKFEITSIPLPIINAVKSFKNELFAAPSLLEEKGLDGLGRAELGLKQAYQLADKDNSGGINMNELTTVLESITSMKKKKQKEVVGLDDGAIALLVGLMGLVNGARENGDVDYNREEIIKLFQVMDLDGDGNVSWWEWRQVLEGGFAVMLMNSNQCQHNQLMMDNNDVKHIYPLDPLLVTLEAVHSSLMVKHCGIIRTKKDLPVAKPYKLNDAQLSSSDQLKLKIAKLKARNSRLQMKLEAARDSSHDVDVNESDHGDKNGFRSLRAEEQARQARELLEIERKRRTELEVELEKMYHTSNEMTRSRSILNSSNQRSLQQLHAESDRLRQDMVIAHMSRRRQDKSALILQKFFFKLHKKYLEKKEKEERNRLITGMERLVLRKRHKHQQASKIEKIVKIQTLYRQYIARKRMKIIRWAAGKIHEAHILRKMRKAAGKEKEKLQQQLAVKRMEEAAREKKRLEDEEAQRIRMEQDRQDNAATRIQSIFRGNAQRKSACAQSLLEEVSADDDQHLLDDLSLSKDELFADESVFQNLGNLFSKNEEPDEVVILRTVPRPDIDKAVGYWVSHNREHHLAGQDNASDDDSDEREAKIFKVDLDSLNMQVVYLLEDPPSEATFHYDDPTLTWLRAYTKREVQLETEATIRIQSLFRGRQQLTKYKAVKDARRKKALERQRKIDEEKASTKIQSAFRGRQGRKVAKEKALAGLEDDTVETDGLDEVDRPPIEQAAGYWIKIPKDHQEGLVDKIDISTGIMQVMYDVDEDGDGIPDGSDMKEVEYLNPELIWLKEHVEEKSVDSIESDDDLEKVERPPIADAPGHWIRESSGEGLVDKVDVKTGMMKVMYEIDDDGDGEVDRVQEKEILYSRPELQWMRERSVDKVKNKTELSAAELSAPSERIAVVDRPPIEMSPGYWVKSPVDGLEGLVDTVDVNTGVMHVLCDVDEDGDGETDRCEVKKIEYSDPDLIWMRDDEIEEIVSADISGGSSGFEVVDRPPIEDAPGHWVKSPDGLEGLVDSVDVKTGMMKVMHKIDDYGDDEVDGVQEKEIPYSRSELQWMRDYSVDKVKSPLENKTELSVTSERIAVVDRPPIEMSPGYWVKSPVDGLEGLVDTVDVNTGVMHVLCDVDEDGDGETDRCEVKKIEYSDPDLIWMRDDEIEEIAAGSKNDVSVDISGDSSGFEVVNRPPIEMSPGHWVRSLDGLEGLVDKADTKSGIMRVLFDVDDDGDGETDRCEVKEVDYSNPDLVWMTDKKLEGEEEIVEENDVKDSEDKVPDKVVDRPPLEGAAGSWIRVGASGEEGLVDKIDIKTGKMRILFDKDSTDEDQVATGEEDYYDPNIVWLGSESD